MDPIELFPTSAWLAMAALFGAIWGSFANVFIWRWPAGLSVARPASHCPHCGTPVAPYDNVPVLSFLLLGGRCRACAGPISWRYPAVEAAVALLSVAAWKDTVLLAGTLETVTLANYLVSFAFCWALVVIAFIDLDTQLVPSGVTGVVAALGLAAHVLLPGGHPTTVAIGAALGFGAVWTLNQGYRLVRGQPGMGMGDAYIMAMVGAHLGWQGVLFTFVAGAAQLLAVQALLYASSRSVRKGPIPLLRRAVPLGPFLAASALEFYVLGDRLDPLFGAFG